MKNTVVIIVSIFCFGFNLFAQDASTYFPADPAFKWNFEVIPLDSVNNEIDSLAYFKIDSIAANRDYNGKLASIIVSKVGVNAGLPFIPLIDSTFISFDGSDVYSFTKFLNIDSLISSLLSPPGSKNNLSKALENQSSGGWFSYYHFAQAQNQPYQILSMDTTVDLDGASISIRFEIKGKRLADQIIQTKAGEFNCKKFNIQNIVSYLITTNFAVPLITGNDSVWIAQNEWIVQEIVPTTKLDLSLLGFGAQYFPGKRQSLIPGIPTGIKEVQEDVSDFKLYQNYPNPFNPTTIIRYSIPDLTGQAGPLTPNEGTLVQLKVYDILGNEVATLVNEHKLAGNYEVEFNPALFGNRISSGIYLYRLKTGTSSLAKKLVYLK